MHERFRALFKQYLMVSIFERIFVRFMKIFGIALILIIILKVFINTRNEIYPQIFFNDPMYLTLKNITILLRTFTRYPTSNIINISELSPMICLTIGISKFSELNVRFLTL